MPRCTDSIRRSGRGSRKAATRSKPRNSCAKSKLGTPGRLIAPPHTLTLPSLRGIQSTFEASHGFEAALLPARVLINRGLLGQKHLAQAESVISALDLALQEVIDNATTPRDKDAFEIEIRLTDNLGDRGVEGSEYLYFLWGNTSEPRYIPLRPFYDQLEENPYRDRLMASLYHWVYQTTCRIFSGFGFEDAKALFTYRQESYKRERENGQDVDLEGEVECAHPSSVVNYIRHSKRLMLKQHEVDNAFSSILGDELGEAFVKAHSMFTLSRSVNIPMMTPECRDVLEDAAYYINGDPVPAVGVSHWRDDAIVSWLDEYCQEQFNSGVECRMPVMKCFRADDQRTFGRLVNALPRMVRTAFALSEWYSIAEKMEYEAHYGDRDATEICA